MKTDTKIIYCPEALRTSRSDLFSILETLLGVRFSCNPIDVDSCHGAIRLGSDPSSVNKSLSTIELGNGDVRQLKVHPIDFANSEEVPWPFRSRSMPSSAPQNFAPLQLVSGEKILASIQGMPVWARQLDGEVGHYRSAFGLPKLEGDENLSDVFKGDRFIELLPLVHWLREVTGATEQRGLPLRAQFMFDDPNLHWPTYGHVDYREIVSRGERANYHVSFATIPLDNWYTHGATAALFRSNPRRLSLLVHGNNHVHRELAQAYSAEERVTLLQQSLRRIEKLETASGVAVSRVMAAPHGACSEDMLAELPKCGFAGATISHGSLRAHNRGRSWVKFLGYSPAEIIAGCAVMPRWRLAASAKASVLIAAYLRQPIILVGHHGDLKDGLELLDDLAAFINSLGNVAWLDMAEMAHASYTWRMDRSVMLVRPMSPLVSVSVPTEANSILVVGDAAEEWDLLADGSNGRVVAAGKVVPLIEKGTIKLKRSVAPSFQLDRIPEGRAIRPFVRRLATEARDRLVAIVR